MGLFAAAEEVPKAALQKYAPFGWETFTDYLDWLDGRTGVNVVTQVGHSAVRRYVMGEAALERAATDDEISEMVRARRSGARRGRGRASAAARRRTSAASSASTSRRSSPTAPRPRALAEAVRRTGTRLLSINPATKRDGLDDDDQRAAREARRDLGRGRVVERLRHGNAQRRQRARVHGGPAPARHRDLRHCSLPAVGDPIHAQEAVRALRELRALGRVLEARPARQARGVGRSGVARPPGRVLGQRALHGERVGREGHERSHEAARRAPARRHRRGARRHSRRGDVRRRARRQAGDVLPDRRPRRRRRVAPGAHPQEPRDAGRDLRRRSPSADLRRRRLHQLLPRPLGSRQGRLQPRGRRRGVDLAGRRLPRARRSGHARGRQSGRRRGLRSRRRRSRSRSSRSTTFLAAGRA